MQLMNELEITFHKGCSKTITCKYSREMHVTCSLNTTCIKVFMSTTLF